MPPQCPKRIVLADDNDEWGEHTQGLVDSLTEGELLAVQAFSGEEVPADRVYLQTLKVKKRGTSWWWEGLKVCLCSISSGGDGDEEMEEQGASPGLRRMNARERAVFWSVWCKQHGFPVLASVALRLLSMHPTSCASERNWSVVGQLYSKARSNLALERARKLVYVRCNQVDNVQLEQLEHFMELLGLEDG